MADESENQATQVPALEPEPEYSPPTLVYLGTLAHLTQAGPVFTSSDGIEGHS